MPRQEIPNDAEKPDHRRGQAGRQRHEALQKPPTRCDPRRTDWASRHDRGTRRRRARGSMAVTGRMLAVQANAIRRPARPLPVEQSGLARLLDWRPRFPARQFVRAAAVGPRRGIGTSRMTWPIVRSSSRRLPTVRAQAGQLSRCASAAARSSAEPISAGKPPEARSSNSRICRACRQSIMLTLSPPLAIGSERIVALLVDAANETLLGRAGSSRSRSVHPSVRRFAGS